MKILLEKAEPWKKDVLFRLLQYSLFEESIDDKNVVGEDGLFAYPWFEQYFEHEDREAYFIKEQDTEKLLGFVMINTYMQKSAAGHSIAEFMVLPPYRRSQVGKKAAFLCFGKHKGNWEVSPACGSRQAYLFWEHVIREYTDGNYGYEDNLFLFSSHLQTPKDTKNLVWEEVCQEHIIQNEWIDFRQSSYRFPDGRIFGPFYSYSRKDYVVIVASDEEGNYLCVRQFRQGIKKVTTEFPAGGIERTDGKEYGSGRDWPASEKALDAAKRELLEETGYVSDHWTYLLTVPSNATMADNYAHIFTAEGCHKYGEQDLDETEFLDVKKYSAAEMEEMIHKGDFQQAIHIMAWLMAGKKP